MQHPGQAADIEDSLGAGQVVVGLQQALPNDASYQALLTETANETDIANIVSAVMPLVLHAIAGLTGITIAV